MPDASCAVSGLLSLHRVRLEPGQVRRPAQQFRQQRPVGVEAVLGCLAAGDAGPGLLALANVVVGPLAEVLRQLARQTAAQFRGLGGMRLGVVRHALLPGLLGGGALVGGVPARVDVVGYLEGRVVPADVAAGGGDLLVAQRRPVARLAALLVGRALADECLAADQRGPVRLGPRRVDGGGDGGRVVAVHLGDHVPAVGLKAPRRVVGEPALHLAVDGDAVVVVEGDQLAQPQGACQRARLVGDALHEAAVPQKHPGVVIDHLVALAVVAGGERLLGNRHAHRVAQALAQRAGGGLDPRRVAVLRVAGGLAVQLAKVLELLHRQRVARQVQQRVDQHGPVAVGQHEAVPAGPLGVGGVVAEIVVPQHLGDVRHAHGSAGVAAVGPLHRVHAEGADGVGEVGSRWHVGSLPGRWMSAPIL